MYEVDEHKQCLASLSRVLSDHVVLIITSVLEKHKTEPFILMNFIFIVPCIVTLC